MGKDLISPIHISLVPVLLLLPRLLLPLVCHLVLLIVRWRYMTRPPLILPSTNPLGPSVKVLTMLFLPTSRRPLTWLWTLLLKFRKPSTTRCRALLGK